MTNSPEATTPDSSRESTTTDAAAAPDAAPEFERLVEPRSENRLALESGVWHQISPKYVIVQFISTGSFLLVVIAATLVLTRVAGKRRAILAERL